MKSIAALAFALSFAAGTAAHACSFAQGEPFAPNPDVWEWHFSKNPDAIMPEAIPLPVIKKITIQRGTEQAGASCADAGILTLDVSLPKGTTYKLDQFGVYFRVKQGTAPKGVFPPSPIVGEIKGKSAHFFFAWLDGAPADQSPLDFVLEVFFVTGDLSVGQSTFVKVSAK